VSLATAKAAAESLGRPAAVPYIGGCNTKILPVPMMNILNGGKHADNNVDFQEFMVMPIGAKDFPSALQMGAEIFHTLKGVLKAKGTIPQSATKADSPRTLKSNEEALEVIMPRSKRPATRPARTS
jgi:enolase